LHIWIYTGDTFPLGCAFSETIVHHEVMYMNLLSSFYNLVFFWNIVIGPLQSSCNISIIKIFFISLCVVFQGQSRLSQPEIQHKIRGVLWKMWTGQRSYVMGSRWVHVPGNILSENKPTYHFISRLHRMVDCFIHPWMEQVAKMNNTTLPPAALFIIRFHSFYRKQNNISFSL